MTPSSPQHYSIAFDLDGTLIDTAPDLIRVLDEIVAEDGLGKTDYAGARTRIGFGSRALLQYAYGNVGYEVSDTRLDAAQADFLKRYADSIADRSVPFAGVVETLAQLKRDGHRLSVCTNKPGYLARPLIEALGMTRYFDRIVGADDAPAGKPDPRHIFAAVGHRRTDEIIMVGDGLPDVWAAKNAGVPCFLMSYGYSTRDFYGLRAAAILRKFRDLPTALKGL